ncbi:Oligopeptide/dipeptide transporter, C-terminal region [Plantibacter sp. VKM Ac-1784]|uniref:Oligopeptide/dipeptide transporter, C-terminal region n=1 Tax=Plantibacter elymi (nom. nud.) TaxID=199708 RepID=A0ABY1RG24_9MICO|nr:ATP-binding cassette domain-containing protein [Plantibacter sp. VKM Ac-1784]SMQ71189.1 Oligopeptide/dipeptide transporter, C-terminal region [Plantibacter sp. VKM Ac-1784]
MSELLEVSDLTVAYSRGFRRSPLLANDRVSVSIPRGKTLGIVGESGSGKSTLGDAILGFAPVSSGSIRFDGEELVGVSSARRRELTKHIQVIFQNPYGSLNPAKPVGATLLEPLIAHRIAEGAAATARVAEWLDIVGLSPEAAKRYPGDFSGGQRQRIAIARALLIEPDLVICDEAVSALDLSIQAQILNLLLDLQHRLGVSYVFITHDMAVVEHMADRTAVMHRGVIVEEGPSRDIIHTPTHEYTQALLAAAPSPDPRIQQARRRERTAP